METRGRGVVVAYRDAEEKWVDVGRRKRAVKVKRAERKLELRERPDFSLYLGAGR